MSHRHFSDQPFPRAALVGAAALLGFALLAAAVSRLGDRGTTGIAPGQPLLIRELQFRDRPDGSLVITAAAEQQVVAVLAPGSGNFVRGVLRGLNRDRKLRGIGPEPGYRLTRWRGGGLSLRDLATDRRIDLEPFGSANLEAFARLLPSAEPAEPMTSQAGR